MVLKHAGRWLHFQCPEKVLVAGQVGEVVPMLAEAEASGLYAAGFLSYEAAPAFDPALQTFASVGFPLLCLGLFQPPEVLDGIEKTPLSNYGIGGLVPSVTEQEFSESISRIKEQVASGAT